MERKQLELGLMYNDVEKPSRNRSQRPSLMDTVSDWLEG